MRARQESVRHYVPGGRENGGGIGRLVGYIVDAETKAGADHRIRDTRGPAWSPGLSGLRLAVALLSLCSDRITAPSRIQHIHVAGRGSTLRKLVLSTVARWTKATCVLHLHDYDYAADLKMRHPVVARAVRRMFRRADQVIVLGRRDRDTMVLELGVDPSRVAILHNCVPDPGLHDRSRHKIPTILFLGRLSERKGVPELLRALADDNLSRLSWRAVLAGDGPVAEYRAEVECLGLGERVAMPGWLDEAGTREVTASADILALPSHAEGLAMAVLEAMANGLAVVTTPVGAHDEAIVDGISGLFVPAGDVAQLATALAQLVAEPDFRAQISSGARDAFLDRFEIEGYGRRLNSIYATLGRGGERLTAAEVQSNE